MTITDLLDAAKTAQGFSTDMALAKALGISRSAVSAWRTGVKTPDTVQCAAIAGYTGIPLVRVLGIVGEARAISREEKAIWRKVAATAAAFAGMIAATYLLGPAQGASALALMLIAVPMQDVYIMRNVGRKLNPPGKARTGLSKAVTNKP